MTPLRRFSSIVALVLVPSAARSQSVVYQNHFGDGAPGDEWSERIVASTPRGSNRFLGTFENDTVTLTLGDLPSHDRVTVSLRLYIIHTWDGCTGAPESWEMSVDDRDAMRTSFSNSLTGDHMQRYPSDTGCDQPPGAGAEAVDTLGFPEVGFPSFEDAVYRIERTFRHATPTAVVAFRGVGLQGGGDEYWGIDDVVISIDHADCNRNGLWDSLEVERGLTADDDGDGVPDECQAAPFRRGDANSDGAFDISDPLTILGCLFRGGRCTNCPDAADANDDGRVDLTDAIYLLEWRFKTGPYPAPPFEVCGRDRTADGLALCAESPCGSM